MDRKSRIIEFIDELYNKGYSYSNICVFLAENDILSKKGEMFTKSGIRYYIKRYKIKRRINTNILLKTLYFKKDRYYFLLDKEFKPINVYKQLETIKNMADYVEKTKLLLNEEEFQINVHDYNKIISMLRNNESFKVYNKRFSGDYPGRNLLAAKLNFKGNDKIILKNELFEWMRQNDQYLIYSENGDVYLRGIIQTNKIFFSYSDSLSAEGLLEYIYVADADNGECVKESVCSEDSFKIAVNTINGMQIRVVRINGEIDMPKFIVSEEELYQKIKNNAGVKALTYADMNYVTGIYKMLEYEKLLFKKQFL